MRPKVPLPQRDRSHLGGQWELDGPLVIDDLEMTRKAYPCRYEGTDDQGRRVLVRYQFRRLAIEVEDRFALRMLLEAEDPGATEHTLSRAGLKQACFKAHAPVTFPF